MVKFADVEPWGTKTLFGTAEIEKLESCVSKTLSPPTGDGAVSVTVPVVESPLSTVEGLRLSEERNGRGGTSVKVPVCEMPP